VVGSRVYEARALVALGDAQRADGDTESADATRARAAELIDWTEPVVGARLRDRLDRD
jgi:hypothetical protein